MAKKSKHKPTSWEKWMVEQGAATPVDDATPETKPKTYVVVWHEVTTSGQEFGVSKRFTDKLKALMWLESAVSDDQGGALSRDHKVMVTWHPDEGRTVTVDEDCGHEVNYQIVELTNGDD